VWLATVLVPVFELGMSFGKVKSGKSPEKVWKNSGNLYLKLRWNTGFCLTNATIMTEVRLARLLMRWF